MKTYYKYGEHIELNDLLVPSDGKLPTLPVGEVRHEDGRTVVTLVNGREVNLRWGKRYEVGYYSLRGMMTIGDGFRLAVGSFFFGIIFAVLTFPLWLLILAA